MKYLLREVDQKRWVFEYEEPHFPAKPLGDLKVDTNGNLSVFEIDEDENNLDIVILACILQKHDIKVFQYIKLSVVELEKNGFRLATPHTKGTTLIKRVNDSHRDLKIGTAEQLVKFAKFLYSKSEDIEFKDIRKVKSYISQAIMKDKELKERLNCDLQKKIKNLDL